MRKIIFLFLMLFSLPVLSQDSTFSIGVDHLMNGEFEAAQTIFLEDINKAPSYSSYYNLGVAAGELGQWNKAKWAFESSLKYLPLSNDAQFNAQFASSKINPDNEWKHPYPWVERVFLGFGVITWTILISISSLFLGWLIFKLSALPFAKVKSIYVKLLIPAILLFCISIFGVYTVNTHFEAKRFAILKDNNTQFFISPNLVKSNDKVNGAYRLEIVKFFKNEEWVQVKTHDDNYLWVKNSDIYSY